MSYDRPDLRELTFLNFEIRGLGQKFAAAIEAHEGEMQEAINHAVDTLTKSGRLQQIVEDETAKALAESVRRAVSSWECSSAIKDIVIAALKAKP